ncbi:MAG: LPXTG cell wall anchor domain-containing protein [Phycisphaera sp.]|nr:LPXTG cell wall anchor domain-containing protein [Phycisphaera sp.]
MTTLTVTGGVGTSNFQGVTFAQTGGSQWVPGIGGLAAIAGVGLVGRRRRRRRR